MIGGLCKYIVLKLFSEGRDGGGGDAANYLQGYKSSKPPVHSFLAIEVIKNYLMGNSWKAERSIKLSEFINLLYAISFTFLLSVSFYQPADSEPVSVAGTLLLHKAKLFNIKSSLPTCTRGTQSGTGF